MARKSNSKRNKNSIQNVRIVDKDEGTDDIMCQRFLQSYNVSEGQIRVVCGWRSETGAIPAGTTRSGLVGFSEATTTDDFTAFITQYREFRIRAMRFDIYDIQPNSSATTNYWATYHTVGGTTLLDPENIMDRPDCRVIAPGDGRTSLCWVAHSIPEMAFQSVTNFNGLGGLSWYAGSDAGLTGSKYTITAKFVIDFRGRQ